MAQLLLNTDVWSKRRARAGELAQRWAFAAEVLTFYAALLEVQERAYAGALEDQPRPEALAAYAAERVLPRVVEVSAASGPAVLVSAVLERFHELDLSGTVAAWLRGDDLRGIERFLARAAAGPLLEALGAAAGAACEGPRDALHCPVCGGRPQLSYFASSTEDLVTASRFLLCGRCAGAWAYPRLTCAGCGETDSGKLLVYSEVGTSQAELNAHIVKPNAPRPLTPADAQFPHMRVDGCSSCRHYHLTIDLDREPRGVPLVDEIAAIPLDLYARERGLTKLVPNLMGI